MNFRTFIYIVLGLLFCTVSTAPLRAQSAVPGFEALPVLDSLPDWQVGDHANRLADAARALRDSFIAGAENATVQRARLEQYATAAKKDTTFSKDSLKALSKQLVKARTAEKEALKLRKEAENAVTGVLKIVELGPEAQRKNLPKAYATLNKVALKRVPESNAEQPIARITGSQGIGETPPPDPGATPAVDSVAQDSSGQKAKKKNGRNGFRNGKKPDKNREVISGNPSLPDPPAENNEATAATSEKPPVEIETPEKTTEKTFPQSAPAKPKKFKNYDPAEDVVLSPPVPPCVFSLDTKDEFSGEIRRETAREELFRYTNPVLKNYLQGKTHVVCESAVSGSASNAVLTLTLTVNDPGALKTLGNLPRNSSAIFKFIDGSTFNLFTARADDGAPAASGQAYIFKAQFPLDRDAQRKFRNEQIDKIRLSWSNGYEDYDVYNIDLVKRQCNCLK
jgi:hypothetical protein